MTTSGTAKASHIRTKRAAFSALEESRQPPRRSGLLATMPTVRPPRRPRPTTMLGAHLVCSSTNVPSSRNASIIGWTSYARREESGSVAARSTSATESRSSEPWCPSRVARVRASLEGGRLGVGGDVDDAAAPTVRLRAAEPLHVDVLAGDGADDLGTGDEDAPGRAEDDDVGERRSVGGAAGGGAEHHGDLRHLAGGARHRGEHAAHGVEAGDALAQARAAGVPQADDGCRVGEGAVVGGDDRAAAGVAHGPALHGRVGGEGDDVRAVRAADGGEHAAVVLRRDRGELAVVEERGQAHAGRAGVELGLGGRRLRHVMRS